MKGRAMGILLKDWPSGRKCEQQVADTPDATLPSDKPLAIATEKCATRDRKQ
jgi:hypothetical protein